MKNRTDIYLPLRRSCIPTVWTDGRRYSRLWARALSLILSCDLSPFCLLQKSLDPVISHSGQVESYGSDSDLPVAALSTTHALPYSPSHPPSYSHTIIYHGIMPK